MGFTVYVHTNKVDGKKYVGATTKNVKYRWGKNGRGYENHSVFHAAIEKYGWDGFWHEIIGVASKEDMYALEQQLIALYNTTDPMFGYNSQTGGDCGYTFNDAARKKLSEANSNPSEETRRKLSEASSGERNHMYGKHHSDETRKKMSVAHSNPSEETRKKMSVAHSNPSEETRRKISVAHYIPILQFTKDGDFIREWCSAKEAGVTLGIYQSNITSCCKGKRKLAGKYVWKYKNIK